MIEHLKKNIANLPGWRTRRKIVVFESDDWGSIRMPSKKTYEQLTQKGLAVDQWHYDRVDRLESSEDLQQLFDVLLKVKDKHNRPCVFTFNTVMGNPDFGKIAKTNFTEYHFEHFRDTYLQYFGDDIFPLWEQGIAANVIHPQFHGREHLNVSLWLKGLQTGDKTTRIAFDHNYFGMPVKTPSPWQKHYLAAFAAENQTDLDDKIGILADGLKIFNETFGYPSTTFIACNYIWPKAMEASAKENGINLFQGQRAQLDPLKKYGRHTVIRHFVGQKNKHGQTYLVRNCVFEPSSDINKNWVDSCLNDIAIAFFWGKPAIISTHRVNFMGGISAKNRDKNLKLLKQLLVQIKRRWPEVEFLSSAELGNLICTK